MFDKVDGFIRDYVEQNIQYYFGPEKYEIRYLIGLRSTITYVDSHDYAKKS